MKKYKLKHYSKLRENQIKISLDDLRDMNDAVMKDKEINGFLYGFEEIKL